MERELRMTNRQGTERTRKKRKVIEMEHRANTHRDNKVGTQREHTYRKQRGSRERT